MLFAYAYRTLFTQVAIMAACVAFTQQPFELDPSFELSNADETAITSILADGAGGIIFSGDIEIGSNIYTFSKLLNDGSFDPSFGTTIGGGGLIIPWNDSIYVGSYPRRFSKDGVQDVSYIGANTGPYFSSGQLAAYHVYPDGRVLMGGQHSLSDTIRGFVGNYSMIWFSNTGYLDTTKTHRAAQFPVWTMKEQIDGKFMLSTSGGTYEGYNAGSVLRVHPDGERDTTFQSPIFFERAHDIVTLPSGKYLVGGGFKFQQNSPDTLGLVRLNHDGSLDSSFHIPYFEAHYQQGTGLSRVYDILDLGDGRIIVTGAFDHVDGQPRGSICMLDTNGNLLNDAFAGASVGQWLLFGSIPTQALWGITHAPDGSFYIYGSYHGYNDGTNNYPGQRMISRLYGVNVGVNEQDDALRQAQDDILFIYPNPGMDQLNITLPQHERKGTLFIHDMSGRLHYSSAINTHNTQLHLPHLHNGIYLVRFQNEQGEIWRSKWVKE